MKRMLLASALLLSAAPVLAADIGVSIGVNQPGLYGQINIGGFPAPQVIYPQPVIIQPGVAVGQAPIYLHVPPGHERRWGRYCGRYNACGRPVMFVQDGWYNQVYAPRHGRGGDDRRGWDDGYRGDRDRGEGRGEGHGGHHH